MAGYRFAVMKPQDPAPIPEWVFRSVFPFGFAWDASGRMIGCGRSLQRLVPVTEGSDVSDLFTVNRPAFPANDWRAPREDTLTLLEIRKTGLILRGQIISMSGAGPWLFAGAPWIKSPDHMDEVGIKLSDYAPSDTSVDMLYVIQAQKIGNREMRDLNLRLKEQGKLLAEREEQARKLAFVAERTGNAVIITDSAARIEWVNQAFENMTGWAGSEVVGRKPGDFLQGPHSDPSVVAEMRARLRAGEGFSTEIVNYRKDGHPYWASIEVRPITDEDGRLTHYMALEADISERKLKETRSRIEAVLADVIALGLGPKSAPLACLEELAKAVGAYRAGWWRLEKCGTTLHFVDEWAYRSGGPKPGNHLHDTSLAARKRAQVDEVFAARAGGWSSLHVLLGEAAEARRSGFMISVPVMIETQFFGVFQLFCDLVLPPDQDLMDSLCRFGSQVGLLLQRLEAEEAFKEAERISHLGHWSMNILTGRIEWSDEKYRIYGHAPQQFQVDLEFCLSSLHPEDRDGLSAAIAKSIEGRSPLDFNYRIIRPHGEVRHLHCQANVEQDSQGNPVSMIGTVQDVTELMLARDELERTEQRWQLALESHGLGVWDWDLTGGRIDCSDSMLRMLGYKRQAWTDKAEDWEKRIHKDERPLVMAQLERCLADEAQEFVSEHRMLCRDRRWKWVRHVARVVSRSDDGSPLRMIGTQMDIDVIKKLELSSSKRTDLLNRIRMAQGRFISESRLEDVFPEMLDIVVKHTGSTFGFVGEVLYDTDGTPHLKSYGITDISWDEQTRNRMSDLGSGGLLYRDLNKLFETAMTTGEVVIANEAQTDPKAGELPPEHPPIRTFMAVPVFHGLEMVGLIGVANHPDGYLPEDIQELDPFIAAMSSMIVARREDERRRVVEEELRTARDQAEAANHAKNDFLAMISHEIRTPMNGVLGMASLLRGSALDKHQTNMIDAVIQSGKALVSIIEDILDFSKVESGLVELKREPVVIDDLLEGVADLFALEAAIKDLDLVTVIDPSLPRSVWGDFGRLRQILLNLTGNALKFTNEGYVVLMVSEVAGELEFSVQDTGIGVKPEDVGRLFKPFSQIDASITRQHGGTGLGLAICKKLVGLMDGEIGIDTRGPGSRFWFRIRLEQVGNDAPKHLNDDRIPVVWIADRSDVVRLAVRRALEGMAGTIREASSQEDFHRIRMEADVPADLVLIDGNWLGEEAKRSLLARAADSADGSAPRIVLTRGPSSGAGHGLETIGFPIHRRRVREAASPKTSPDPAMPSHGNDDQPLGLKVLVAEDNALNSMLMTMLLDQLGCTWRCAVNGLEAVEMFESHSFDAILMDCQMPLMDGCEAAGRIRRLEAGRNGPQPACTIIAITANALETERQRCLAAGMDAYLAKPFEARDIADLLRSVHTTRPIHHAGMPGGDHASKDDTTIGSSP